MSDFKEQVEVKYSQAQNQSLDSSFRSYYKLDSSPRFERRLIVTKDSYRNFIRKKALNRTPFEPIDDVSFTFDVTSLPFEITTTVTKAILPSGEAYTITEVLDSPNGVTQSVYLDDGSKVLEFKSYLEAEINILQRYLNGNNH